MIDTNPNLLYSPITVSELSEVNASHCGNMFTFSTGFFPNCFNVRSSFSFRNFRGLGDSGEA